MQYLRVLLFLLVILPFSHPLGVHAEEVSGGSSEVGQRSTKDLLEDLRKEIEKQKEKLRQVTENQPTLEEWQQQVLDLYQRDPTGGLNPHHYALLLAFQGKYQEAKQIFSAMKKFGVLDPYSEFIVYLIAELEREPNVNKREDLLREFLRQRDTIGSLCFAIGQDDTGEVERLLSKGINQEAKAIYFRVGLMHSVLYGNTKTARYYLEHGVDANSKGPFGGTYLMSASRMGYPEIAMELIQHGADVNVRDDAGRTALMFSERDGHRTVAELLRRAGALELPIPKQVALMEAVLYGNTTKVEALLNSGADINAKDPFYGTPLMAAALGGHTETVSALLARGAHVDEKYSFGDTALLHEISTRADPEMVETLLGGGANVNISNQLGDTALMWAAKKGDVHLVKGLLAKHADVNAKDNFGITALMLAQKLGHTDIVKVLRESGAVDFPMPEALAKAVPKKDRLSVRKIDQELVGAVENGDITAVRRLLGQGADPNVKDSIGSTVLMVAAQNAYTDVVLLLLEKGARIEERNEKFGHTALIVAARRGHTSVVEALLSHGADVNARSSFPGTTALTEAARHGHTSVVKALLSHGADVNARSFSGTTALTEAAQYGNTATVEALLDYGADPNSDALTIAKRNGHNEIIQLLKKAGAKE